VVPKPTSVAVNLPNCRSGNTVDRNLQAAEALNAAVTRRFQATSVASGMAALSGTAASAASKP
jgi:hypothetical protein